MNELFDKDPQDELREKIMGLGDKSFKKSYYPQLKARLEELEKNKKYLENRTSALLNILDDLEMQKDIASDNEIKFRELTELLPEIVFELDLNGYLTFVNSKAYSIFGYSHDDLITGVSSLQMIAENDQEKAANNIRRIINERISMHSEYTAVKKNGTEIPVIISSDPMIKNGECIGIRGLIIDISEIKNAETNFLIMHSAVESAVFAIGLADLNGIITYVNPSYVKLWGYNSKDEILGSHLSSQGIKVEEKIQNCIEKGGCIGDAKAFKKDRTEFDIQYSISVVKDKYGSPMWLMASFLDISDKKAAERELKQLNENLELLVSQRTEELNNTLNQLEQTNNELRQLNEEVASESYKLLKINEKLSFSENNLKIANETKDKFFSIIAHDLRGPFSGFLVLSELLAKEYSKLDPESIANMAQSLNDSAKQLFELLENLLEWSRAQTGRLKFEPNLISLSANINKNVNLFNEIANKKSINISSMIDPNALIFADTNLLNTIIRNLISNSIKFTNPGGSIIITYRQIDDKFGEVAFTDNGVGMSKEIIDKIFLLELKYSTKGTANEQGTGLGLVLCKELVEKGGGSIKVESNLGKGSTFLFTVPISKEAIPQYFG